MRNVLFTFQRRAELKNGEKILQDNFLNPAMVTSFFWEHSIDEGTGEQRKDLAVFTAAAGAEGRAFRFTFGEKTGMRFVQHMEDFLRYSLGFGSPAKQHNPAQENKGSRPARRASEVIDDIEEPEVTTAWVPATT